MPANEGLMRPIKVVASRPDRSLTPILRCGRWRQRRDPQRIVDVLFKALAHAAPHRIAAATGSMSNLTVGGYDSIVVTFSITRQSRAEQARCSAIPERCNPYRTTNTLNTPIEALEAMYPMRITEYRLRRWSGCSGRFSGGDGSICEMDAWWNSSREPAHRTAKIADTA